MIIDHIAVYVKDLETMKEFYEKYFGAKSNRMYHNPKTGLKTYFLSFDDGSRLEIMNRPDITKVEKALKSSGYIHIALNAGSREAVDKLTGRLKSDGYSVIGGPRTTGDGYYESCVLDPEGNQIEIISSE